jgi:hypothetical protein
MRVMRTINVVSTVVVILMGIGHTTFTPVFAPGWTQAAAWFSGSGLALLFIGLLNAARLWGRGDSGRTRVICLAGNLLTLLWIAFVIVVLPVPQAFVVAAAILGATIGSLARTRRVVGVKGEEHR